MIENQKPLLAIALSVLFSGVSSVDNFLAAAQIVPNRPMKIVDSPKNPINIVPSKLLDITIASGNKMIARVVDVIPLIKLTIDNFDLFIKLFLCKPIVYGFKYCFGQFFEYKK